MKCFCTNPFSFNIDGYLSCYVATPASQEYLSAQVPGYRQLLDGEEKTTSYGIAAWANFPASSTGWLQIFVWSAPLVIRESGSPILRSFLCLPAKTDEVRAYQCHRNLSQGTQRASGIRLFALLTFLSSFEGKCCDLRRFVTWKCYWPRICDKYGIYKQRCDRWMDAN